MSRLSVQVMSMVSDNNLKPIARRLVVVEPEPLLRWSLSKYLGAWFEVLAFDAPSAALSLLANLPVDALIISDALTPTDREQILAEARERNQEVFPIWTVTTFDPQSPVPQGVACLEKPFQLAQLAKMLHVKQA